MSKGLEALESGIDVNTKEYGNCIAYTQDCIDIIEKELKALEIVVKKNVVTSWVKSGVSLEEYNDKCAFGCELTREELEILNEALCDEIYKKI